MYLYLLYNVVAKKGYIGITARRPGKRFTEHLSVARLGKETTYLAQAMRKYGLEAFTLTVLRQAKTWDELKELEIHAIAMYNTMKPNGYNLTKGGDGNHGYVHTEETRKKLSESTRQAYAEGRLVPMIGRTFSEETKAKMREANRRQNARGRNPMQGKHHSDATKALLSAMFKGKPTGRQPWNKGIEMSEEYRAKLSKQRKGRRAWNKGVPYAESHGYQHPSSRAIEFNGMIYPSVMACHKATGFSRMRIRRWIENGKARYVEETP